MKYLINGLKTIDNKEKIEKAMWKMLCPIVYEAIQKRIVLDHDYIPPWAREFVAKSPEEILKGDNNEY